MKIQKILFSILAIFAVTMGLMLGTADAQQQPSLSPAMVDCYGQNFAYCFATKTIGGAQLFPREMCSNDLDCEPFISCLDDGRCNTGLFVIVSAEDKPDPLYTITTSEGDTVIDLIMDESVIAADLNGGFMLQGLFVEPPGWFIAPIEAGDIEFLGDWASTPSSIPSVTGPPPGQTLEWENLLGADPLGADAVIRIHLSFVAVAAECSNNGDCDDGEFCNGAETCDGGYCVDSILAVCEVGEVCVEEDNTCVTAECVNDYECDDLQFCTGAERCRDNQCVTGTPPCEAGEVCVDEDNTCVTPECTMDDDCDDGRFCNGAETCNDGQCQDSTSPCAADEVCVDEIDACVTPECTDRADCDNGFFCDGLEACVTGQCVPGTPPCGEGEICLDLTDECTDPECSIDDDCDDGRFCNGAETCDEGRCQDGTPACGAGEICVEIKDVCVEAECIFDIQCDDGRFCNGNETCDAGRCQSENTSPCGAGESCEESIDECVEPLPTKRDGIIATWSNGLWYWDIDTGKWTLLSDDTTKEDIAAADFTADGTDDVAAIFESGPASGSQGPGIYYLDGVSKTWTRLPDSSPAPSSVTAGDLTGDGRPEVIVSWNVYGIWYWDFAATTPAWIQLTADITKGDLAAADFTADGIADVAASFDFGPASNPQGAGLYYLNGSTKEWTRVPNSAPAPFSVTAGDLTADGRPEVIATWSVGVWYWDFAATTPAWTQLTTDITNKAIAAGNFVRSDKADVAAIFEISPVSTPSGPGLYYLNGVTGAAAKIPDSAPAPFSVTAGDVTGD